MWTTFRLRNDRWKRKVNWAALYVFADEPAVQGVWWAGGRLPFWRLHMRGMQGKTERNDYPRAFRKGGYADIIIRDVELHRDMVTQ